MSIEILLLITVIQFAIQYGLYVLPRNWCFRLHSMFPTTIGMVKYELIAINIFVSIFVKIFTAAGAIVGITNLFASCLLALIMTYQYRRYKADILSGRYYDKLKEKMEAKAIFKQALQHRNSVFDTKW